MPVKHPNGDLAAVREIREKLRDRIVHRELALVDQPPGDYSCHGLGDRRDSDPRVGAIRHSMLDICEAECLFVDGFASLRDEDDTRKMSSRCEGGYVLVELLGNGRLGRGG